MELSIRHETLYRYTAPQAYSIQQLHITPRAEAQQSVQSWHIHTPGHCHPYVDAYGNLSHMLTLNESHDFVTIVAQGVITTRELADGRLAPGDPLPPLIFTVPTRLTQPTPEIVGLASRLPTGASSADLLRLAEHIVGAVPYQTGATTVATSAHDALLAGAGVCQDHAHLFLACCHARGIPARYVSGYIDPESTGHAASHAWVDAWVEQGAFAGWVSIDVTHMRLMTAAYCRLAIGRDYDSAAPVRGSRRGRGDELMSVNVVIRAV